VQAALLVARNLQGDRRSLIRVDQERRRRSVQCSGNSLQMGQLDRTPANQAFRRSISTVRWPN
jgi:hypothetical protein